MGARRARRLFDRVARFDALLEATLACRRGKRQTRSAALFELDREHELCRLEEELLGGRFRFSGYRTFDVREPVVRRISAAPFRDRVVHQALASVLTPIVDRCLLPNVFACRAGKGTHRAIAAVRGWARTYPWAVKVDVRRFFHNVDHALLLADLRRKIADRRVLALLADLIATHRAPGDLRVPVPGESPAEAILRPAGLPIGNLTSQLFANWYLAPVDRLLVEDLGVRAYARYMDDLVILGHSKRALATVREAIDRALGSRLLVAHPTKSVLFPVRNGIPFLGFRLYRDHVRVRRGTLRRMVRRLRSSARAVSAGRMPVEALQRRFAAYRGLLDEVEHRNLLNRVLDSIWIHEPGRPLPWRFAVR